MFSNVPTMIEGVASGDDGMSDMGLKSGGCILWRFKDERIISSSSPQEAYYC